MQQAGYLGCAGSSEDALWRAPVLWERKRRAGSGAGPGGRAGTHSSVEPPAPCGSPLLLLSEKPPPCRWQATLQYASQHWSCFPSCILPCHALAGAVVLLSGMLQECA